MVVVLPPLLDDDACFVHGREFFAVQAFVSELSAKTLDVSLLLRIAWLDVRRIYIDRFKEPCIRLAINSGPLSLRMILGTPRMANRSTKYWRFL